MQYDHGVQPERQTRRATLTGIIAALFGILLFAWYVRHAGAAEIWAKVVQVGWGLVLIIVLGGLRFAARAAAWSACVDPPDRLPFGAAFAGVICGDTLGNLTPLGPIVGEPAKAAYVRGAVRIGPALTALAIENLIYTISVAAIIAAAMVALVFTFDLPAAMLEASEIAIAVILAALTVAGLMLWRRPTIVSAALARLLPSSGGMTARVERVRAIEHQIYTFATRRRDAVLPVLSAEIAFHALGVLELYVTWWMMMGSPPPLLLAFVLEGANRLITVVFKVVPLRLGVDETSTGAFTQLLGYGITPGFTLGVLRRARMLFWVVVGTALLVRRGLSPRRILQAGETWRHPPSAIPRSSLDDARDRSLHNARERPLDSARDRP